MATQRLKGKGPASNQGEEADLPYAIDAEHSLSPDELGVLQDQYILEQDKGYISIQTKFNLAWWVGPYSLPLPLWVWRVTH